MSADLLPGLDGTQGPAGCHPQGLEQDTLTYHLETSGQKRKRDVPPLQKRVMESWDRI